MNSRDLVATTSSRDGPDAAELIGRAASGEHAAFHELVRRYHSIIYRWAAVSLGDRDEAEDVTQLVLIKVYGALGTYRGGGKLTTWLYRITQNVVLEWVRRRDHRGSLLRREYISAPVTTSADEEGTSIDSSRFAGLVRGYMESLPPRQREVFLLADLEGFTPAEIAELLDVEQVTVRTNLFKARRAIRSRMLREQPKLMEEYRS